MLLLIALVSWVGSTYTAHALGARKGRHYCWLWGFLVGWIGVAVVALWRPREGVVRAACLSPRYEKRNKRPPGEDQRWAELVRQAELDRQRAR